MNKLYFCRNCFLIDWHHKHLKNTIDLLLFYREHFYGFLESVKKQTLRLAGKLIFCRLIACPYLVIRACAIHTAVWRVIWSWFLIGWRKDDLSCLVHSDKCSKQKKALGQIGMPKHWHSHMKHKTFILNVIHCCG